MGNTVPPRASRDEATGRRVAWTGRRRRSENLVTESAPPATPCRRVVATARKQGWDDVIDDEDDVEEDETSRAGRPRAGGDLWAAGADGAAPAAAGKVLTVKIVMTRKDAEALVARLKAQSARERKARMAELKGELRAGSCGGGGRARASPWSRDARRPMLPPIKEDRFERTPLV